jgi:hypothetical protein
MPIPFVAPKWPTPGTTTASAASTVCGDDVVVTEHPMAANARATEARFPAP